MRHAVPILFFTATVTAASAQTFDSVPAWMEPELDGFGDSVAACGDMNGDGYDDVIVGGPGWNMSASQQPGAVQIYQGSETGLSHDPRWFWGGDYLDTMGLEVAFAGDVNGDGYDDVAFNFGGFSYPSTHGMYVQLGHPTGYGVWEYDSGIAYSGLGPSIDGGGDVNGDGYDDIVSGFKYSDAHRGRLRAFYGSSLGLPQMPSWEVVGGIGRQLGEKIRIVGDVNGDGYDDVLVCDKETEFLLYPGSLMGLESTPAWRHPQSRYCAGTGIGAAGDLNADGYDDVLVGRYASYPGPNGFHVFLGSSAGLADKPTQTIVGDDGLGYSMAPVGDVNGDGYDDVVVGQVSGRVYLFLGSEIGVQPTPAWTNDPLGTTNLGQAIARAGDVNGDGLIDLLVGAPGESSALLFPGIQWLVTGPAGSIDGASLLLGRDGEGRVVLNWSPSCAGGAEDYAVYRGTLGDFESHVPVTCSSGGLTSWTVSGTDSDRYYLVVPRSLDSEGSYGEDGYGSERAPSLTACFPQTIASCE